MDNTTQMWVNGPWYIVHCYCILDHSYFISSVFLVLYLFWYVVVASIIVSCCNFLWLFSTNKNLNISVMLLLSIVLNSICIFHLNTITSFSQSYLWPYLRMTSFSKYENEIYKALLKFLFPYGVKMILPISYYDYGTHWDYWL